MTVEDIIKQVTDICKKNHVEHLSLFGSYAKGTQTKYSDLDFIIYGKADMEGLQEQVYMSTENSVNRSLKTRSL